MRFPWTCFANKRLMYSLCVGCRGQIAHGYIAVWKQTAIYFYERRIPHACSATTSLGNVSLRGRPLGRGMIPAAIRSALRRSRLRSFFTTYLSLRPKYSAISRCVFPAEIISFISGSNTWTCVYSFLAMIIPPDVVLLFSYIRGVLSIVRFYWTCANKIVGLFFSLRLSIDFGRLFLFSEVEICRKNFLFFSKNYFAF